MIRFLIRFLLRLIPFRLLSYPLSLLLIVNAVVLLLQDYVLLIPIENELLWSFPAIIGLIGFHHWRMPPTRGVIYKLLDEKKSQSYRRLPYIYVAYYTIALISMIRLPHEFSVFALPIILFVWQDFIVTLILVPFVVASLSNKQFKYTLTDRSKHDDIETNQDVEKISGKAKIKQFLIQYFATYRKDTKDNEHNTRLASRLSEIEINAIADLVQSTIRKELKAALNRILFQIVLLWCRRLSFFGSMILSFIFLIFFHLSSFFAVWHLVMG